MQICVVVLDDVADTVKDVVSVVDALDVAVSVLELEAEDDIVFVLVVVPLVEGEVVAELRMLDEAVDVYVVDGDVTSQL